MKNNPRGNNRSYIKKKKEKSDDLREILEKNCFLKIRTGCYEKKYLEYKTEYLEIKIVILNE